MDRSASAWQFISKGLLFARKKISCDLKNTPERHLNLGGSGESFDFRRFEWHEPVEAYRALYRSELGRDD